MTADYEKIAAKQGVSTAAVEHLAQAIAQGQGKAAQFNHPELSGMGQWMPTMIMIGDMFNNNLKAKVDAMCRELAGAYVEGALPEAKTMTMTSAKQWWADVIAETPVMSGSQNDSHYAWFAEAKRLLINRAGQISVYDTGVHHLNGVAQQQNTREQTLTFRVDNGKTMHEDDFERVT